jgi:hypothetical protein
VSEHGQFEEKPGTDAVDCTLLEQRLAEAAEDALPAAEAAALLAHGEQCESCSELLLHARQGHDWLGLLRQQDVEPPAGLVDAIVARTSGASVDLAPLTDGPLLAPGSAATLYPQTFASLGPLAALRRLVFDPRIALTAAMAFFSITLTLNMLGVRLGAIHASDLTPDGLHRLLTRQYVQASANVVRYYENLRFVYEVESSVRELRRAAESSDASGQPMNRSGQQHPGSSSIESAPNPQHHALPLARAPVAPTDRHKQPSLRDNHSLEVPLGPLMDAALHVPAAPVCAETSVQPSDECAGIERSVL